MPVPPAFNYDAWLGSTPAVHYTEDRVHPQSNDLKVRYGRPGWLRLNAIYVALFMAAGKLARYLLIAWTAV